MHGDHTPFSLSDPAILTPLGANQMYDQGAAFRNRYLRPSRHGEFVGIVGIHSKHIDNSQLKITSSTDYCSSASATAFLQGLYPPSPHAARDLDTPAFAWSSSGSISNYPLGGYQYPNIMVISPEVDPDSIWSHGHSRCTKHSISLLMFSNNSAVDALHQSSKSFYSRLWDRVLCEAFPRSQASFHNAYDLYDYASYRWNHDNTTRSAMTSADLERLRDLAWKKQALKHADISSYDENQDNLISAIAGRTLAARAAALFAENIESGGERNKLSLAFTSHEPFLGFFALTGLAAGASSHLFTRLPDPGAALTLELFSIDLEDETDELYKSTTDSHDSDNQLDKREASGDDDDMDDDYDAAWSYNGETQGPDDEEIAGFNDPEPASPYDGDATRPCHDRPSGTYDEVITKSYENKPAEPHGGKPTNSCVDKPTKPYDGKPSESYNEKPTWRNNDSPTKRHETTISHGHVDYPPIDKLYVRFLYRNSTDTCVPLVPHPLFGSGHSSMSFKHFNTTMSYIGVANYTMWCKVCESDAGFCKCTQPPKHDHLRAILLSSGATLLVVAIALLLLSLLTP